MPASVVTKVIKIGLVTMAVSVAVAGMSQPPEEAAGSPAKPTAAATPGAAAAGAGDVVKGREIFDNFGCASCHVLKDAGASGHVGPTLDGNPSLTYDLVKDRVTNGQGPMPAFGGQLSEEEIANVSAYVMSAAAK